MTYYIHPTATVDKGAFIGDGTKIWHYCHVYGHVIIGKNCVLGQNVMVQDDVAIGNNVKIQNNVSVYTGVRLYDDVFVGPSVVFTNVKNPRSIKVNHNFLRTLVMQGASIGANATIVCGVSLGTFCFVGAGSVVTKAVPAYGIVYGNPARLHGYMCECGEKLVFVDAFGPKVATCPKCYAAFKLNGDIVTKVKDD